MILGIDLDGCAYPFLKNFVAYAKEIGVDVPEDWTPSHWNFFEDFGLTVEQFVAIMEQGVAEKKMFINSGFMDMPEPGFSNVMIKLRGEGHKIHIVTHRNVKGAARQTLEWMDIYKIPTDAIHFVRDKTVVGVDLLVDDSPDNYYASASAGIPCVLYDQPYNQFVSRATRVADWHEYYELVQLINRGELVWSQEGRKFVEPQKDVFA